MEKPKVRVTDTAQKAFRKALKAREAAHAPYSKFKVGAALVANGGEVYTGCNVENASYGGTVCAERVAIFKAVSQGSKRFTDVVVVTNAPVPAFPCALCLQVMAEFLNPRTRVWVANTKEIVSMHRFEELLPHPFGPRQLKGARS